MQPLAADGETSDGDPQLAVDPFGALAAAEILPDHIAFGARGGPAFIPQENGQFERGREVASIGATRLRTRPLAAVHIAR